MASPCPCPCRLGITRWHLAGTRVTAQGVALLAGPEQPRLLFLDVRGTGMQR